MAAALELNPEVVWVVTTGENGDNDVVQIRDANARCRARINTLAHFAAGKSPGSVNNLWRMAQDNGGLCTGDDASR